MLLLDMQARLMRSWLQLAETNVRAMTGLCLSGSHGATGLWLSLMGFGPSGPRGMPGGALWLMAPFAAAPLWQLGPWGARSLLPLWTGFGAQAAGPWPWSLWGSLPAALTPSNPLVDAMLASYRTGGGHAATAIFMPSARPLGWPTGWPSPWTWPLAWQGRLH